jgi:multicomponent Na+:H+ antiporter subunit D
VIASHLPALQVVIPLMAAPLCIALRRPALTWGVAVAVTWLALASAVLLLLQVTAGGPISYELGGWAPPWGIEYRIDQLNAFLLVIVAAIGATVIPYAKASVEHEIPAERIYLFYGMYLLSLAGLLGIAITGDVFNLFVFLEISSLSSYVLISLGRHRRALTAAYRYLIMGTIGATFYVIGVGLMYMMTGTLNMEDLAGILPAVADTRTVLVALAFLTVGISLKLALFPLHVWLPNAYTYAPSTVTVFLAGTATKVAVYVFIRIYFTVFGNTSVFEALPVRDILIVMALAAMFIASAVAIFQDNVKRMMAYSSLAQIGYMVLGIGIANVTGLTAGIVHLFNHALMKAAIFMALGSVFLRTGSVRLEALHGLGRRMPFTMAAIVAAGLSLIGVPLTVGFVSKWYLIQAAIERGWWWMTALILLCSLLAIVYVWRLVEVVYFQPSPENAEAVAEAPVSMLIPMWILIAAVVYFGIDATRTVGIAKSAATFLLRVAP